jgi:hypothetical protein
LRSNEGKWDLGHAKTTFKKTTVFPELEGGGGWNVPADIRGDQFDHGLNLGYVGMVFEVLDMLDKFKVLAELVQINSA